MTQVLRELCLTWVSASLPNLLHHYSQKQTIQPDYSAPLTNLVSFYFPVSQWCMQFPFLLLVCKFTCSQNSSPGRLLLRLKCKVCTPTCQLHELAVAIINFSEGQQTFAINGDWSNSGICKIQIVVRLPEKFIHLVCTTSLPSYFSEVLKDPSNMNSSSKQHLSYSLMRIPRPVYYLFF